jgi:prepilin-type N-terminal cleavage/methylation domain-containing protein
MKKGFTVLEIIIVIVALGLGFVLFFTQKLHLDALSRDQDRKVAINAMYFSLEEDFHAKNGYYPETISEDNLKTLDPNLFTDPNGILLGDEMSSYRYEPVGCDNDQKCKSYTLRAILEKEADFVRNSRN